MRRLGVLAGALLLLSGVAMPASAISEDELRAARLELESVLANLEAANWDRRIATDTEGLMQFEYDQLAGDADLLVMEYEALRSNAAARSLEIFAGGSQANWANEAIAHMYLEAAVAADRELVAAKALDVEAMASDLELIRSEVEFYGAARQEADARVVELSARAAVLDEAYASLALAYETEVAYNATTTTTTTTVPPTTTTVPPTNTSTTLPPPTTTTSTTTTTTLGPTTTTTTVPGTTTTTVPAPTTATTTTLAPPVVVDGKVCPVQGPHHFIDSFGAPRSGGRTHAGVDMMADRGTPLVAIESGTMGRLKDGGLGGITVWFYGDSGDDYYYAHMDDWASGLVEGQYLAAGDLVGYVGSTGNAPEAYPHLHFEIHPGGEAAINPYPTVAELCL